MGEVKNETQNELLKYLQELIKRCEAGQVAGAIIYVADAFSGEQRCPNKMDIRISSDEKVDTLLQLAAAINRSSRTLRDTLITFTEKNENEASTAYECAKARYEKLAIDIKKALFNSQDMLTGVLSKP